jgi:guanylate kinase
MTGEKAMQRRGLMFVLSSASGAGKTTLSRRLLEDDPDINMSVSVTTRAPRPNEKEGIDYYFVSPELFEQMVQRNEFLEYATVFGNRYGTPRDPVMSALSNGKDVLFDIDWQGTQQLSQQAPSDVVRVFILPPSKDELERRLTIRAMDPPDVIALRMSKADEELSHWAEYDYVVINENIVTAQAQLESILAAERLKRRNQIELTKFISSLRHSG